MSAEPRNNGGFSENNKIDRKKRYTLYFSAWFLGLASAVSLEIYPFIVQALTYISRRERENVLDWWNFDDHVLFSVGMLLLFSSLDITCGHRISRSIRIIAPHLYIILSIFCTFIIALIENDHIPRIALENILEIFNILTITTEILFIQVILSSTMAEVSDFGGLSLHGYLCGNIFAKLLSSFIDIINNLYKLPLQAYIGLKIAHCFWILVTSTMFYTYNITQDWYTITKKNIGNQDITVIKDDKPWVERILSLFYRFGKRFVSLYISLFSVYVIVPGIIARFQSVNVKKNSDHLDNYFIIYSHMILSLSEFIGIIIHYASRIKLYRSLVALILSVIQTSLILAFILFKFNDEFRILAKTQWEIVSIISITIFGFSNGYLTSFNFGRLSTIIDASEKDALSAFLVTVVSAIYVTSKFR